MSDVGTQTPQEGPWASDRINENNRRGRALREIAEKARWYAGNDARDPQEVDHALCVEVLALAEDALDG